MTLPSSLRYVGLYPTNTLWPTNLTPRTLSAPRSLTLQLARTDLVQCSAIQSYKTSPMNFSSGVVNRFRWALNTQDSLQMGCRTKELR